MRCHYEVLALERDASPKDVKKAFHLQALRWHPDKHQKNNISPEEATLRFQEIQSAYEVLSDQHERKWYDDHREQILRDDADADSDDEDGGDGVNLFRYFSPGVYAGFGDDDKSFYSVYSDLFKRIDELDLASASPSTQPAPAFGGKRATLEEVNRFYQHWANYLTPRSFAWVDEYRTTDAPSRQIRRAMEKENKKLRDAAKKAFTTEVRKLVDFVCRRDQRVLALQKQREKDKAKQQREDAAKKQARQAAFEAEREAFQQQERARWEALETTNQTSKLAQDHIDDELEKMRAKMDAALLLCDLCRKTFRSPKQLQNHLSSKKHKDMELELGIVSSDFASLEAELELELQAELAAAARKTSPNGVVTVDEVSETAVFDDDAADEAAVEDPVELEQRAKAAEAARVAEEARVLKEQKAADKRKERKEQRKQAKKEGVEKLVTGGETTRSSKGQAGTETGGGGKKDPATATNSSAKHGDDAFTDSEDDGRRGARRKGGKGGKKR